MRHYKAFEIQQNGQPTGKYHFACSGRNGIHPVGYCAKDCPGHDTPEAAAEHYRQWILDHEVRIGKSSSQNKCKECGEWTQGYIQVGECQLITLCEKHQSKETLEKYVHASGEIWAS